jgi:hypothetical protein
MSNQFKTYTEENESGVIEVTSRVILEGLRRTARNLSQESRCPRTSGIYIRIITT